MGTPYFARPSLKGLLEAGEEVLSVYTQPDRPKGRSRKSAPSPIKDLALSYHLPVYQPVTLKEKYVQDQLAEQKPDVLIVVAFGLILPQGVLNIPKWGAVNVHASLLPKYRGAAPIQWSILYGEKQSGITTMRLDAGMDTGDILLQEREPIFETDTAQSLHDRLAEMGGRVLKETLARLRLGTLSPQPQDSSLATYAPPLKKNQGEIQWDLPAEKIARQIRGLFPWPGAFTFLHGKRLLIHQAGLEPDEIQGTPGMIRSLREGAFQVCTGQGTLSLKEVQLEGHRRMSSRELLQGFPIKVGDRLGFK
jgi:methionyl-tRNA formyltransferase